MGRVLTQVRNMIRYVQKLIINRKETLADSDSVAAEELENIWEELENILDYIHEDAMDDRNSRSS